MQNNFEDFEARSVDKGEVVAAKYIPPELPKFKGNPLIEALPPINTRKRAITLMQRGVEYSNDLRLAPAHLRSHMVMDILHYLQPLPNHLRLESGVSRVLRDGYLGRNPLDPAYWGALQQRLEHFRSKPQKNVRVESTAAGFAILGMSGMGKTTAIRAVLFLYPQIIIHNEYRGEKFTKVQVLWLRLQCPKDGSTRSLCVKFFAALDELLGTKYEETYGGKSRNTEELLWNMGLVAANHHLGILVIDEIQNLSQAHSGGAAEMLAFFVELINQIGLPVLLIGTYLAVPIVSKLFSQARRCSGQGDLIWDAMEFDEDWNLLVETLWDLQYVQKPCKLTKQLSMTLHELSYGIVDLANRIYMAAQWRAIETKLEEITEPLLRSAYRDDFRLVSDILETRKSGNLSAIEQCSDLFPPKVMPISQTATADTKAPNNSNEGVANDEAESQVKISNPQPKPSKSVRSKRRPTTPAGTKSSKKKNNSIKFEKDDLRGVIAESASVTPSASAYESLLRAGCLKSANEFV